MVIACDPAAAVDVEGLSDWESLYRLHYSSLVALARRRGCDPHGAEDVVQDVFLNLVRRNRLHDLAGLPEDGQRAYLRNALRWGVAHFFRLRSADRRGGKTGVESLDVLFQQGRDFADPKAVFGGAGRRWASDVLERGMARFREGATVAQGGLLDRALFGRVDAPMGGRLSSRERVALHRCRVMLRQCLAAEAGEGADVEAAKQALLAAAGGVEDALS